ncbi:uncharacterized protein LOC111070855 [Drosophila obscura]|uniref:uncharacterized protein LOC111070855 n=1 Tax=Drosophila obscura TaxID=7282 RepID=UPI000BA0581A|nr:uncharacterized protein LOC111070855 [Drosophila obscura]XP_022217545.1 uncharacterized protein LOC111070855 [Drosophila obscura]XP_022217546.1 uncharacterized protein LOC111070855 [Drosophila obscura]XP_022217547.1 uncharacterized protein LOC111070855 [Drosophila obscura]XP_041449354.1 uncharacterized protein LOC111070855 [Drosophila obscura]XP_041449355.1 uncharacterized protein LOC111070855 [Drosophila obscura]
MYMDMDMKNADMELVLRKLAASHRLFLLLLCAWSAEPISHTGRRLAPAEHPARMTKEPYTYCGSSSLPQKQFYCVGFCGSPFGTGDSTSGAISDARAAQTPLNDCSAILLLRLTFICIMLYGA